jgi:rRNA-processing protein FCF1
MNPFKRKNEQRPDQSVVLDTSGIIDGRILEIAKAGFVPTDVVVPQFVIAELQFLADHGDTHKRERARYGLDVIRELQDIRRIDVIIARDKFDNIREVDDKLVALAKRYGSYLYTTDFNLNKVAQIEGVAVLNVNELAHALRPNLLPGERVIIKLTQVGQDKAQGVGYLQDGTMVVVEQGGRFVGQQVQAICTRILQTQAGKMMFATISHDTMAHIKPSQPEQNTAKEARDKATRPARAPQRQQQSAPRTQQPQKKHDGGQAQQQRHNLQQPATKQHQSQAPQSTHAAGTPSKAATPDKGAASAGHNTSDSRRRSHNRASLSKNSPVTEQSGASQTSEHRTEPKTQQVYHAQPSRKPRVEPAQPARMSDDTKSRRPAEAQRRRRRGPRRLSPEDSLLATIKETQQ